MIWFVIIFYDFFYYIVLKTSVIKGPACHSVDSPKPKTITESEFVSDKFIASEIDLVEIQANIKKLGIDSLASEATHSVAVTEKAGKNLS